MIDNSVLDRTVKVLVKNHWSILVKAAIPTPAGFRRPDIVAWKGGKACYIIDVTVVVNNVDLDRVHQLNIEHYTTQHVRDWALRVSGTASVTFSSLSFNWRGPGRSILRSTEKQSQIRRKCNSVTRNNCDGKRLADLVGFQAINISREMDEWVMKY